MTIFLPKCYLLFLVACLLTIYTPTPAFSHPGETLNEPTNESRLSPKLFATFIRVEEGISQDEINRLRDELNTFVAHLQRKQKKYRSEQRFLSYFFYRVHRQFLKRYQSHTTMRELLTQGHYDCVTGSALYALLLDALSVPYRIHEFPYHVYLTVTTADQDTIMIESTDPRYGFVTSAAEQAKRRQHYRQGTDDTEAYYQYDFTIQSTIGLPELAGLSYFNEAVEYYNRQEFQQATQLLQQANRWYRSPRTEAFAALITSLSQK